MNKNQKAILAFALVAFMAIGAFAVVGDSADVDADEVYIDWNVTSAEINEATEAFRLYYYNTEETVADPDESGYIVKETESLVTVESKTIKISTGNNCFVDLPVYKAYTDGGKNYLKVLLVYVMVEADFYVDQYKICFESPLAQVYVENATTGSGTADVTFNDKEVNYIDYGEAGTDFVKIKFRDVDTDYYFTKKIVNYDETYGFTKSEKDGTLGFYPCGWSSDVGEKSYARTTFYKVVTMDGKYSEITVNAAVAKDKKNAYNAFFGLFGEHVVASLKSNDVTTYYSSLKAAWEYAADQEDTNSEITLLESSQGGGMKTVSGNNATIIVDLGGFKYTCTKDTVGSSGTETNTFQLLSGNQVTFKNGTITAIDNSGARILIQNYCDLTLENVKLIGSSYISYVVSNNFGSMTVTGNTEITATDGNCAFDVYYWPKNGYGAGVSVTFDDKFTGKVTGNIDYGSDGTADGIANIGSKASLVINGGTFIGDLRVYDADSTNIQITGGTFSDVNMMNYLNTTSNVSVVLQKDSVAYPVDMYGIISLDLNGHKLVSKNMWVTGSGSVLTLKDTAGNGVLYSDSYGICAAQGATVVVDSATIDSKYACLSGNNTYGNMNFHVNAGSVLKSRESESIYMSGQLNCIIDGGKLYGGISMRMGKLVVNGGEIYGMTSAQAADDIESYWNYSGSAWIGDAIFVMAGTYSSTAGNDTIIEINGGKIVGNAHNAIAVYDIGNNYDQDVKVFIKSDAVIDGSVIAYPVKASTHAKTVTTSFSINTHANRDYSLRGTISGNIELDVGVQITFAKNAVFEGAISCDNNHMNGKFKAKADSIIRGGSLTFDGDFTKTTDGDTIYVSGSDVTISGSLDPGMKLVIQEQSEGVKSNVTLKDLTSTGSGDIKGLDDKSFVSLQGDVKVADLGYSYAAPGVVTYNGNMIAPAVSFSGVYDFEVVGNDELQSLNPWPSTIKEGTVSKDKERNAGEYTIVYRLYLGEAGDVTKYIAVNWTILPAPVDVTINDITKVYDGEDTLDDEVEIKTSVTGVGVDITYSTVDVSDSIQMVFTSQNNNYIVRNVTVGSASPVSADLVKGKITPATIIVTPDSENNKKTYGDSDPELTYTSSPVVSGQSVKFTGELVREAGEDYKEAGYEISKGTLELADNGTFKASNYVISFTAGKTFMIEKRELTLGIGSVPIEKEYDGSDSVDTLVFNTDYVLTNVVTGDEVGVGSYATALFNSKYVDATIVTITGIELNGADKDNYFLKNGEVYGSGTVSASITQRVVTVAWGTTTFIYNGEEKAPTATVSNLVSDDNCDVTVTVAGEHKDANTVSMPNYTATASGLTGTSSSNYKLPDTAPTTDFTIDPLEVNIAWGTTVFTYNGTAQAPTATVSNLVSGDNCDVTVTVAGEHKDANTALVPNYTATATALSNTNYKLPDTAPTTDFTIGQAEIGISWTNIVLTYNGTEQKPTAIATGLFGEDTCNITVSGGETNAGTRYTATADSIDNPNYKLPGANTITFEIAKKPITINWTETSKEYNGVDQLPVASTSDFVSGFACDITVSIDIDHKNVGDYTAKAAVPSDANYEIAANETVSFEITAKSISGYTMSYSLYKEGEDIKADIILTGSVAITSGDYYVSDPTPWTGVVTPDSSVTVTVTGQNNFTGTLIKPLTFDLTYTVKLCTQKEIGGAWIEEFVKVYDTADYLRMPTANNVPDGMSFAGWSLTATVVDGKNYAESLAQRENSMFDVTSGSNLTTMFYAIYKDGTSATETWAVEVTTPSNGTVSTVSSVPAEQPVIVFAQANSGYYAEKMTVGGVDYKPISEGVFMFYPASDVIITVTFTQKSVSSSVDVYIRQLADDSGVNVLVKSIDDRLVPAGKVAVSFTYGYETDLYDSNNNYLGTAYRTGTVDCDAVAAETGTADEVSQTQKFVDMKVDGSSVSEQKYKNAQSVWASYEFGSMIVTTNKMVWA